MLYFGLTVDLNEIEISSLTGHLTSDETSAAFLAAALFFRELCWKSEEVREEKQREGGQHDWTTDLIWLISKSVIMAN